MQISILGHRIPSHEIKPPPFLRISRNKREQPPRMMQHIPMVCILRIRYHIRMGVFGHMVDILYPLLLVVDLLDQDFILVDEAIVEDEGCLVGSEGEFGLLLVVRSGEVEDLEGVVLEIDGVFIGTKWHEWLVLPN